MGRGGLSKKAQSGQDDSSSTIRQGNTSKAGLKCVCLNARSIINKKNGLNIMICDIDKDVGLTDAELGLEGCVMFRKDRMGIRGGGVLYVKDTIPAYKVQLREEAIAKKPYGAN